MSSRYLPTPAEILVGCAAVQAGWTEAERLRRGTHKLKSYSPAPSTGRSAKSVLPDGVDAVIPRDIRSGRTDLAFVGP
jgi:hypothetical protein